MIAKGSAPAMAICDPKVCRLCRARHNRHTAASYLVMAGVPIRTVGEILGHKSMAMTERYAHLSPEHKLKAVNLLPDWSAGEDRSQTGHKVETEEV